MTHGEGFRTPHAGWKSDVMAAIRTAGGPA